MKINTTVSAIGLLAAAGTVWGAALDGSDIQADATSNGLAQVGVQDTPTQFGDATGGGQDSAGGSELDAMWGTIDSGQLKVSMTGNLEANFNKMFMFFDTKDGGENTLDGDNTDGGFNEIQQMAGMTFDSGFAPDFGLRFEVGAGFLGVNFFNLADNTSGSVWAAGGPGDLPLANAAGGFGVTFGWDNSNTAGVTGASAAGALTADKGWEFMIDMATAFGDANISEVKVSALISNADGTFLSNQVLGETGLGGAGNLGDGSNIDFNNFAGNQFATIVPTPGSFALLATGGLAFLRRKR